MAEQEKELTYANSNVTDPKNSMAKEVHIKIEHLDEESTSQPPEPQVAACGNSYEPLSVFVKPERIEVEPDLVSIKQEPQFPEVTVKVEPLPELPEKPVHQCRGCLRKFNNKSSLVSHQNRRGGECYQARTVYTCPQCDQEFSKEATLATHIRQHNDGKQFSCPHCGRRFRNKSAVTNHKACNPAKQYQCPDCPKVFPSPSTMALHSRMHTGIRPFQCPECDRAFAFKANMARHLDRRHVKAINLTCQLCGKVCKTACRLKYHMRVHWPDNKPFKCEHCHKSYSHKLNIMRHYQKKHPGIEYIAQITDAEIANKGWELLQNNQVPGDFILPDSNTRPVEEEEICDVSSEIVQPEIVTVETHGDSENSDSENSEDPMNVEVKCELNEVNDSQEYIAVGGL